MDKIIEYLRENPIYFWIIVALIAVIVIAIIVAIAVHFSRKKKRTAAEANQVPAEAVSAPDPQLEQDTLAPQQENVLAEPSYTESAQTVEEVPAPVTAAPAADAWDEAPANIGNGANADDDVTNDDFSATAEDSAPPAKETAVAVAPRAEELPAAAPSPAKEKQEEPEKTPEEKPADVESYDEKAAKARIRRAEKIADAKIEKKRTPAKPAQPAKAEEKPATAPSKGEEEEKRSAYAGKWVILRNPDGTYHFELRASNGEKLLSSIDYTSLAGAKNGIRTHKTNIQKDHIVISQNKKGQFFFKLLNGSKQLLCTGETYPSKAGCESAVDSVKRFAETAVVTVQEEEEE